MASEARMFWEDHGGEGPCLLLVHGMLTSAAQWLDNLPALRKCCRPITVELWGHGRSPSPAEPERYAPDHWVAQFEAIRQELGVQRWFLLGYSLGAGATIRYALSHPDRIIGHIFTNSSSGFADADQIEAMAAGGERTAEKILTGGRDALERVPVHPRRARRLPAHVYDALMRDAARANPLGIANIIRYSTPSLSVREAITNNTVPALLICGAREERFLRHRDYAATHMPNLTVENLEVGHGVNMEDAEGFNALACDFIEKWRNTS